jgi:gamma-glutamyltranspeptidase/glutathione hydrolase
MRWAGDRPTGQPFATRSEVIASDGMAATSQPLATQIALDILKRGGNAIDAAIAANAALGLTEPTSCGVGGDLFAIVWSAADARLHGLNGSGRSPAALSLRELTRSGPGIPLVGPLPVSVPGCVDAWYELHGRFGRLPMEDLLTPTIDLARRGFPVSPVIATGWARGAIKLVDQPGFAATYLPGGHAPATGMVFRNPDLARTLEVLVRGGRDAFYRGELAQSIDGFCRGVGCFLRKEDLAEHSSTWQDPVSTTYRGYEVWELPPNGQGLAALQMLNLVEPFDLASMGAGSPDALHLMIEAKKLAFEDRARFYADPDFSPAPVAALVSKEYARERVRQIRMDRASTTLTAGEPQLARGDTVYLTVADRERNLVSLIQSNYYGFGSGLVPDGLGFVLQNRGALFSLSEGHANVFAPLKRPFHTIIPGFVTKQGRPFLSFGVMGGDMQPQGHLQILVNLLDFGMGVQEAGDAPRFYHSGSSAPTGEPVDAAGGEVSLETGFAEEVGLELARRGHRLRPTGGEHGGYQAILLDAANDVYRGASECRKDGQASGF